MMIYSKNWMRKILKNKYLIVLYIMPRVYRRRRPKSTKKKSIDAKQSKQITVLKKKVKALEAPVELKYQYTSYSNISIDDTSTSQTLNLIKPWDSSSATANSTRLFQREGNSVNMKTLMMRGKIEIPHNLASQVRDTATRIRMIYVYYPDEPPGANIADVLETQTPGIPLVDCYYKRNGRLKYKVLKDVTYNLEQNYYNYTNAPPTPVTNSFSGFTSTKPRYVTINHKLNLSKLPASGKAHWKDQLSVPALGQVVLFFFSDNTNLVCKMNTVSQITWHDQ